jgi:CO dehydrogenase nickel-insertion accessory protein CooC1
MGNHRISSVIYARGGRRQCKGLGCFCYISRFYQYFLINFIYKNFIILD